METQKNKMKTVLSAIARNAFLPVFILVVVGAYAYNQQGNTDKPVLNQPTGKVIYENKCGKCHKLFEADKYNAKEWSKWVDKMAPYAKLTAEEKDKVYEYLSTTTKKK